MADILREVFGIFSKRYRDMADGSHAEVVAVGAGTSNIGKVTVGTADVPTGAPITGQFQIPNPAARVRLSAVSVLLPGGSVEITHDTGDGTSVVCAGGSDVTATADGTGNGVISQDGQMRMVFAEDLSDVYVHGPAGAFGSYSAV